MAFYWKIILYRAYVQLSLNNNIRMIFMVLLLWDSDIARVYPVPVMNAD